MKKLLLVSLLAMQSIIFAGSSINLTEPCTFTGGIGGGYIGIKIANEYLCGSMMRALERSGCSFYNAMEQRAKTVHKETTINEIVATFARCYPARIAFGFSIPVFAAYMGARVGQDIQNFINK